MTKFKGVSAISWCKYGNCFLLSPDGNELYEFVKRHRPEGIDERDLDAICINTGQLTLIPFDAIIYPVTVHIKAEPKNDVKEAFVEIGE